MASAKLVWDEYGRVKLRTDGFLLQGDRLVADDTVIFPWVHIPNTCCFGYEPKPAFGPELQAHERAPRFFASISGYVARL